MRTLYRMEQVRGDSTRIQAMVPLQKDEPQEYCPRIEDIAGNCKDDGPKVCAKYMTNTYKINAFNCTCDNIVMLRHTKRFCECLQLCSDHPPPPPPPMRLFK
ncbi:unnamed protein product [Eruca vesicaria subsp. sativa]|uniref:Uncharacterized protein n=1 Tax=Eruca vesicaria subsp. sativa TaxID=29727 RepID=A0ABC8L9L7_ERUVS|nr:unnamed protein product [Eruca vesicaria subsp. sativa]